MKRLHCTDRLFLDTLGGCQTKTEEKHGKKLSADTLTLCR